MFKTAYVGLFHLSLLHMSLNQVELALSPGQTDRQVVASGRKLNLGTDLCSVAKRTRKFLHKYTQAEIKSKIESTLKQTTLHFIG